MQASYEAPVTVTVVDTRSRGFVGFIQSVASLVLRLLVALPFLLSGRERWDGFLRLKPDEVTRFANEYQLHILDKTYSLPYPDILAWAWSAAEIVLPAALVIGFLTRLSAFVLFLMAIVVFLFTPPVWTSVQLAWAAMALALVAYGPGIFSFDYAIWRAWRGR